MPGDPDDGGGSRITAPSSSSRKLDNPNQILDVEFVDEYAFNNSSDSNFNIQTATDAGQGRFYLSQKTPSKNVDINKHRNINLENKFREADSGPFYFFVEHKTLNIGRLHPMKLGEKLLQLNAYEKFIKEISRVGRNRIKVEVSSGAIANELVADKFFYQNEYIAYIPNFLTEKKGVVRYVDTSFSEQQLMQIIKSEIPIKRVQRLNRATKTGDETVYTPRQVINITFEGVRIPQFIYINKVRCPVEAFVHPVVQCFNCLRYGHTAAQCKSNKRCKKCSTVVTTECEVCNAWCVFCRNSNHQSIDKTCPEYNKQKRIKEAMSHLNVSFKEAEVAINNPAYTSIINKNRFAPLINSETEFPSLPETTTKQSLKYIQPLNRSPLSSQQSACPSPKKRKPSDLTPHFTPIRREFNTSFCAGPVINQFKPSAGSEVLKRKNTPTFDLEDFKNKMVINISKFLKNLLEKNLPGTSAREVTDKIKLEESLSSIFENILS